MANNIGVDAQHIVPPSQMKNIWEQNILKKKQEAEEMRKIGGGMQVKRTGGNDGEKAIEQRVEVKRVQDEKKGGDNEVVVEVRKEEKKDIQVNTQGMTLKQRMKVWEQVTGIGKTQNVQSPVKVPETIYKPPVVIKQQPIVRAQPIIVVQQKPILPKVDIVLPTPAAPVIQNIPQPKPFTEPNPGVQTSFIPASKRIGLWQTNLTKHNAEAKKANQDNAMISKQFSRLSLQQQSFTPDPKQNQRSTYMPAPSFQINLQQIIGIPQPLSNAFTKKPVHHEPQQPQMTMKQRMAMMKQTLEKNMKQKQLIAANKQEAIRIQPQQQVKIEETTQIQTQKQQIKQIVQQQINTHQLPPSIEPIEVQNNIIHIQIPQPITAESLKARTKNKRKTIDFDDA